MKGLLIGETKDPQLAKKLVESMNANNKGLFTFHCDSPGKIVGKLKNKLR